MSGRQPPDRGGLGGGSPQGQAGGLGGGSPPGITYSCQFLVPMQSRSAAPVSKLVFVLLEGHQSGNLGT